MMRWPTITGSTPHERTFCGGWATTLRRRLRMNAPLRCARTAPSGRSCVGASPNWAVPPLSEAWTRNGCSHLDVVELAPAAFDQRCHATEPLAEPRVREDLRQQL